MPVERCEVGVARREVGVADAGGPIACQSRLIAGVRDSVASRGCADPPTAGLVPSLRVGITHLARPLMRTEITAVREVAVAGRLITISGRLIAVGIALVAVRRRLIGVREGLLAIGQGLLAIGDRLLSLAVSWLLWCWCDQARDAPATSARNRSRVRSSRSFSRWANLATS